MSRGTLVSVWSVKLKLLPPFLYPAGGTLGFNAYPVDHEPPALGVLTSSLTKKEILVLGDVRVGFAPALGFPNVSA